jgi:hypothetical protein
MSALMPNRIDPQDHHNQRKQQLKTRVTCLKMPDQAYKAINPAITFNLSLEPAFTFTLATFADKGSDEQIVGGRTSFKLQDQVLYLETDKVRYEISRDKTTAQGAHTKYRLAQVIQPYFKDNEYMMSP